MNDSTNRRRFMGTTAAAGLAVCRNCLTGAEESRQSIGAESGLSFLVETDEFHFDTGTLRGTLRSKGRSLGILPVWDCATETPIARNTGLLSHYRLLDATSRYGKAAWDWTSQAQLLRNGSVEVRWSADDTHPFEMKANYRWATPNTLDVVTTIFPHEDHERLEVFLASYFDGFDRSWVYVAGCPETSGKPGFLEARKANADWQMFPRDNAAIGIIQDGRWQRPPHPVQWKIMPRLAAPLAMRRDSARGLVALVMARPTDCFALSTPYGAESHRSLYLSLLGHDVSAGQAVTTDARLIVGHDISDDRALLLYKQFLNETG